MYRDNARGGFRLEALPDAFRADVENPNAVLPLHVGGPHLAYLVRSHPAVERDQRHPCHGIVEGMLGRADTLLRRRIAQQRRAEQLAKFLDAVGAPAGSVAGLAALPLEGIAALEMAALVGPFEHAVERGCVYVYCAIAQLARTVRGLFDKFADRQLLGVRYRVPIGIELGHNVQEVGRGAPVDRGERRVVCEILKQPEHSLALPAGVLTELGGRVALRFVDVPGRGFGECHPLAIGAHPDLRTWQSNDGPQRHGINPAGAEKACRWLRWLAVRSP